MPDPALVLATTRQELARLPALLDGLLGDLEAAAWPTRPAPAEWSPLEIVCHLRDEEVEDFGGLDLLVAWVTHDRLHLAQLAGTLARLWAERSSPLRAEYAGPIPYGPSAR